MLILPINASESRVCSLSSEHTGKKAFFGQNPSDLSLVSVYLFESLVPILIQHYARLFGEVINIHPDIGIVRGVRTIK